MLDSRICWTPNAVIYFTETFDTGDAHGGHNSDYLYFADVQALGSQGGTWTTMNLGSGCTSYNPPINTSLYKCRVVQDYPDNMYIWTNR